MTNQTNRIVFEKPDLQNLTRKNTVVDMHFHSVYSDGRNRVDEIVEYAELLGIGVAITDHNAIQGAVEIDACKKVMSIPGIEVTSSEGTHLLVYFYDIENLRRFYDQDVAPHLGREVMSSIGLSMEDIIGRAKEPGRCNDLSTPILRRLHRYCHQPSFRKQISKRTFPTGGWGRSHQLRKT